jgi:1-acyl-sn-glycerol-3-phosphate acyltransferase
VKTNQAIEMKPWSYEPAADLDQPIVERLSRFPREPDMLVYGLRSLASLGIRGWLRLYHRLEITGRDNLPAIGSFVIIANHASHLDALCLLAALPLSKLHRTFPAAAQDYFFVNIPRLALATVVVNALPFARQNRIRHSLDLCHHVLASPGNILILFPEGTRSIDGRIGEFRAGIGLLVAGTRIPVVPCHLEGAFAAWPKSRALPRPHKVTLRIGKPLIFDTHSTDKAAAQQIANECRTALLNLMP